LDRLIASDHGPCRKSTKDASDSGRRKSKKCSKSDATDQGRGGKKSSRRSTSSTLDQGLEPVSDSNHEPLEAPTPSSHHNDTAIQTVLEIFPNVNPNRALQLHREGKSARTMVSIIAEESCQSSRRMEMIEQELEDEDDMSLGEDILPSGGQDYGDVFLYGQYCEDKQVVQAKTNHPHVMNLTNHKSLRK
jgi:hypothetical protein